MYVRINHARQDQVLRLQCELPVRFADKLTGKAGIFCKRRAIPQLS